MSDHSKETNNSSSKNRSNISNFFDLEPANETNTSDSHMLHSLKNNKRIIDSLKNNLDQLKHISFDKYSDIIKSENELDKGEKSNFEKKKLSSTSQKSATDELQAQLLEQEEIIQEYERSIQALMASFRTGYNNLQEDSQRIFQSYTLQLREEKIVNQNLTKENKLLRALVYRLLNSLQNDIADTLDQEYIESKTEISRLNAENETLRELLNISNSMTNN